MKKKKINYVNNADFLKALIAYFEQCDAAEARGEVIPRVPNYIGECISMIANRMATKPNFSGYSYRDDMIMDGIENCIKYIRTFNPAKTSNPFAYFSRAIYCAFLRRIANEKKEMYIKFKNSMNALAAGDTYLGDANIQMNVDADYIDAFVEAFEEKLKKKKS